MKWVFAVSVASVLTAGCAANIGVFEAHNQTQVELSGPNYEVIATNLRGKAEAYYFLGLFRTSGTGLVYQEAVAELWDNLEKEGFQIAGRPLALANVQYDEDYRFEILGYRKKVVVRADLVEFVE